MGLHDYSTNDLFTTKIFSKLPLVYISLNSYLIRYLLKVSDLVFI